MRYAKKWALLTGHLGCVNEAFTKRNKHNVSYAWLLHPYANVCGIPINNITLMAINYNFILQRIFVFAAKHAY